MRARALASAVALVVVVVATSRSARADDGLDTDRLGVGARVAIPVAVLSYDGAPDRAAGGLLFALQVRGLSRFMSRERGLVFEDGLDLSVAASPFRGVSTGAGFGWRYDAELGVRGSRRGVLLGASIDTIGWAFSAGPGFTSASVPLSLRLEQRIGSDVRLSGTAFVTALPFGARRDGGEVRVVLYNRSPKDGTAREPKDASAPPATVSAIGLDNFGGYLQGSQTTGVVRDGATRAHASLVVVEVGIVETFR